RLGLYARIRARFLVGGAPAWVLMPGAGARGTCHRILLFVFKALHDVLASYSWLLFRYCACSRLDRDARLARSANSLVDRGSHVLDSRIRRDLCLPRFRIRLHSGLM